MLTYFADTNIFLRAILSDNEVQNKKATEFFTKAKNQEISIVVLPEIIEEIEFVLRKVYWPKEKNKITTYLLTIINSSYFEVRQREILFEAVKIHEEKNVDLVDAILFISAHQEKAEVLSFDEDFKKIK